LYTLFSDSVVSDLIFWNVYATKGNKVSISSTIHKDLFHSKVLFAVFLFIHFDFIIFWANNIGAKAAGKMFIKLTPVLSTCLKFLSSSKHLMLFSRMGNHNSSEKGISITSKNGGGTIITDGSFKNRRRSHNNRKSRCQNHRHFIRAFFAQNCF